MQYPMFTERWLLFRTATHLGLSIKSLLGRNLISHTHPCTPHTTHCTSDTTDYTPDVCPCPRLCSCTACAVRAYDEYWMLHTWHYTLHAYALHALL